MRYALRTAIVVSVVAGLLGAMGAANAASSEEQDFAARINRERTGRGLRALSLDAGLSNVARNHSSDMASQNNLHHNPNLGEQVSGWRELGENVGEGTDVAGIHTEFMRSSSHRDEILYSNYTKFGIGTVWDGGTLWVTEVFLRPAESSSSTTRSTTTTSRPRATTRTATPVRPAVTLPPKPRVPSAPPATPPVAGTVLSTAKLEKLLGDLPIAGAADDLADAPAAAEGSAAAPMRLGSVLWQFVEPA